MQEKSAPARLGAPASASALRAWRATHGASTAVGERREPARAPRFGGRKEASSGFADRRSEGSAAVAAPAKPAPSSTFFLQCPKTDHTVTSVLLAAKNFFGAKVQ